ncbi:hypothetical protein I302_104512 [Kwoniella bestiolae CBS 10118]|uniref:PAS domain-containing protein n=1 Tax=Kwoniella bestiolae CBS 10118 TaxID=1296100 RepID=A0A1B9GBG1_9TREE|nr:hypothetical protein I302_03218 [Kwoniella bestiolae CBS 10118]OCF28359.1 hypothetical protein I302_03218 [Kwoniella bestiolae CBS 10118]
MSRPQSNNARSHTSPYRYASASASGPSSSHSHSSGGGGPPGSSGSSRPPGTGSSVSSQEELGLSAWLACSADQEARISYVSESMQEILGYTPNDLIGKSCYLIFHPDEIPMLREIHYQALTDEKTACVAYYRALHKDGYYVECCCSYSTVYNMSLALYTRAVDGQRTLQQALTAREVIEISPASHGKFAIKRWPSSSIAPLASSPDSTSISLSPPPIDHPWPTPHKPSPRTFFIIDRFTDTSRIMYISNDVIINGSRLKNQPFYSMIRPSDRAHVRKYIESAKQSSPIMFNERRSGGHGYTTFHVLKIPDLPPHGETWPQGTDDSERSMPGQEFILVEGIFTASSDGLACIISKINPNQNRNRDANVRANSRDGR